MQINEELSDSGWDRTFLRLSSTLAEPFCKTYSLVRYRLFAPLKPNQFDNCTTIANEIGCRLMIGLGALMGVYFLAAMPVPLGSGIAILGGGSKIFRAIGFSLQKEGFTYVRGKAPEKVLEGELKVMSWNVCGIGGGFHYDHGGVSDWRSRLDGIVKKVVQENPEVLVLQEIYDGALGEALIERLKNQYAHFFFHLGKTSMGSVGGCMILSKCGVHRFSNTDFSTSDWQLKRGFAVLEIKAAPKREGPIARVIGTHLIHTESEEGRAARLKQITEIIDHLGKEKLALPTILAGDLNIERDGEEGKVLLPHLRHGYTQTEPTCTNRLVWQWDLKAKSVWSETIDYISLFKEKSTLPVVDQGIEFKECYLSRAFDESYDTQAALSDHHAIVAKIKFQLKN